MKRIYSAQNSILIHHLHNVLESHGIDSVVKNEVLSGAAGELPPIECWPELWIHNDAEGAHAEAIIHKALHSEKEVQQNWRCPQCKEEIEGQFGQCWKCGINRESC